MLVGLGHVDLVCSDVERSLRFYAAVFGPLGLEAPVRFAGEQGEAINYLRFPGHGSGSLGLRQASVEQDFELYAPGFHHLALAVESRDDVDRAHAAAGRRAPRSCTRRASSPSTRTTTTRRSSSTRTGSGSRWRPRATRGEL